MSDLVWTHDAGYAERFEGGETVFYDGVTPSGERLRGRVSAVVPEADQDGGPRWRLTLEPE